MFLASTLWLLISALQPLVSGAAIGGLSGSHHEINPYEAQLAGKRARRERSHAVVTLYAGITFSCPMSGLRERRFGWKADFDYLERKLVLDPEENITTFNHMEVVTNDFRSEFNAESSLTIGRYCCTYTYKGKFSGTIYQDMLEMQFNSAQVNEHCIEQSSHPFCPVPVAPLPTSAWNCVVSSSSQW